MKTEQEVCFKQVEIEEIGVDSLQQEIKCNIKCYFQATLLWLSLPTIVIDVKPHVLLTNVSDVELYVKSDGFVDVVKSKETIVPFHLQVFLYSFI